MCDTNTESTFNFNTTEAKITKEVCQQFVAVRTGKLVKTSSLCKETKVMLARVANMDKSQGYLVRGKIDVTELTEESGLYTFQGLSEVIFQDNKINWGRVISFFYYAAVILEKLKQNAKEHLNDKVALWLAICVSKKLSKWIKEQGNGWEEFVLTMGTEDIQEQFTNGLFNVTLGIGTLAAALYIQSR